MTPGNRLYALGVSDLEQRVRDNLASDIFLSIILLLISAYALYRLVNFLRVSALPLVLLLPAYTVAGLTLYVPGSPFYVRSDGEFYQEWGFSLAAAWLSGEPMDFDRALWPGKGLWPLIIGGMSVIGGHVTITPIVFNAITLVLTAILLQKATHLLGRGSPRWSIVIVFLSSSPFTLWGPSLLREAIFWLGISFGVLALSYAYVHRYRSAFLAVGVSALISLGIRPDAGMVFSYGFIGMLVILWGLVGRKPTLIRLAMVSVTVVSLAFSFPIAFESVRGGEIRPDHIVAINESLAAERVTSSFGYLSDEVSPCNSVSDDLGFGPKALCFALINLPQALFGPFHWEYGPEAIWLISGASTIHFLILAGLSIFFVVISKGNRWPLMAVLAVATASMLMFAAVLANYGILIRFRAATEVLLIPLALAGAIALSSRVRDSRAWVRWRKEIPKEAGAAN